MQTHSPHVKLGKRRADSVRLFHITQRRPGTMLPQNNTPLQISGSPVDEQGVMARTQSSPKPRARPAAKATAVVPNQPQPAAPVHRNDATLRQLAHELNSLLDGSMRCVGMVRSSLQQTVATSPDIDAAEDGLGKAHAAMRHMAALLERAMKQSEASASATVALFDSRQSLADLVQELEGLLLPHACAAAARIIAHVDPKCTQIPAGPLGTVLMNGLRNALQACEAITPAAAAHEIHLNITCENDVVCVRIDSPHAAKPAGHGIGLTLSEQIVSELGGELALSAAADITSLRIRVPVQRLARHA